MRSIVNGFVGSYQIFRGVTGLIFGLLIVLYPGPAHKLTSISSKGNFAERFVSSFGREAGAFVIAFALIHAMAGYGVLSMKNWGRVVTALLCFAEFVLIVPPAAHANIFALVFGVINSTCIAYVIIPSTR